MKIIPAKPAFGQTLQPGYCGFITREHDIVGDGIEWFERFETGIPFVHTFVVDGTDAATPQASNPPTIPIIEAHAGPGVHRATLDEYLGQKDCQCFIRIPVGWTPAIGAEIVAAAATHLGERYGFTLIVADALANTFFGHCLNNLSLGLTDRFVCRALSNAHRKICSQLVALALQSQPCLRLRGCLRRPADTIMPRDLGNDPEIWDPCIYRIG